MTRYILPVLFSLFLAGATYVVKERRAQGPREARTALAAPAPAYSPTNDREAWAVDFLAQLGNERPTRETIEMVAAWQTEENTTAQFNPLATSQDMPGATQFNSSSVKNYQTYEDGIEATVKTLSYGYAGYSEVLAGLQTNDPERALAGLSASPWAEEGGYGNRVRALWGGTQARVSSKCGYTDTMAIGEGSAFYSTGSGYWSGQYGGMHLGDDMVGNPGDPVYAPWGMTIDSVGRYDDPGRYGANIQAHIVSDGVLFYAGHLIDVYVRAGERVSACTVIGTLGATSPPHVHIKLAGPSAPIPCEGSPPGLGGCLDPLEYWETH